jgi:hypothetical protein
MGVDGHGHSDVRMPHDVPDDPRGPTRRTQPHHLIAASYDVVARNSSLCLLRQDRPICYGSSLSGYNLS